MDTIFLLIFKYGLESTFYEFLAVFCEMFNIVIFFLGLYWKTADVTLTQEYPKLLHTKDGMNTYFVCLQNTTATRPLLALHKKCI